MAIGDGQLFGYNSCVGVAEETTYGTKVDSFAAIEFNSESFKRTREEKKLESINKSRDFIKRVLLNETVEGSLDMDFNPASDACVYILKQAMGGTVSSALITTTLASDYEHTINIGDMENNGSDTTTSAVKSLSMQVDKGGRVWDFLGCRVGSLSLKAEVGGMVGMSAEFIGKTASITSSTPTASFTDIIPLDFVGVTFETGDSLGNLSAETIQSLELSLNNNLAGDTRELGSRNISKAPPLRREVSLKVTQRFDTTTAHNIFLEGTATAIRITFDSEQTMTAASTGSYTYRTVIDLPACYYNSNTPEVGGFETLSHELEISAMSQNTTTAYPLIMKLRNLTTSY